MIYYGYQKNKIVDLASGLGKKVNYARITYTSDKPLLSEIKTQGNRLNSTEEILIHCVGFSWSRTPDHEWKPDYSITRLTKERFENLQEFAAEHGIDAIYHEIDNDREDPYQYFHFYPALVVFTIGKIVEKNLDTSICCKPSKQTEYTGSFSYWSDDSRPHSGALEFFHKKGEDIKDFINEFNKVFQASPFSHLFTYTIETKTTQPRKVKKEPKLSDQEKRAIAESTLKQILKDTPQEVLSFLTNEKLIDKFKSSFIQDFISAEPNTITFKGQLMLGDADGWEPWEETLDIAEFNYIKEWLDAYQKKYPAQYEDTPVLDHDKEYTSGYWTYKDICELFKSFTTRSISNHQLHISGNLSVSIIHNKEPWSTDLEASKDLSLEEMLEEYPDNIVDAILPYAAYWNNNDKKDEFLKELIGQ